MYDDDERDDRRRYGGGRKNGVVGLAFFIVVVVIAIIGAITCSTYIPAGYAGVVYNMNGGVAGEILDQGFHLVSPTKKVTNYSVGIEQSYLTADSKGDSKDDESFKTPTSDGKMVTVNLEFSYKFDRDRLADVFIEFKGKDGEKVKNDFIKPKVIAWTQEVTARYPVTDVFGDKRTEINNALDVYLKEKFDKYGIIIDTVNFTDFAVDAKTEEAIQKKVDAQQNQELAKTQAETARIEAESQKRVAEIEAEKQKAVAEVEAEKNKIAAQGAADAAKIKADSDAEVMRIKAEAEAAANAKIAASLTPELLEQIKIEKWNGSVPTVTGDGAVPIMNLE